MGVLIVNAQSRELADVEEVGVHGRHVILPSASHLSSFIYLPSMSPLPGQITLPCMRERSGMKKNMRDDLAGR